MHSWCHDLNFRASVVLWRRKKKSFIWQHRGRCSKRCVERIQVQQACCFSFDSSGVFQRGTRRTAGDWADSWVWRTSRSVSFLWDPAPVLLFRLLFPLTADTVSSTCSRWGDAIKPGLRLAVEEQRDAFKPAAATLPTCLQLQREDAFPFRDSFSFPPLPTSIRATQSSAHLGCFTEAWQMKRRKHGDTKRMSSTVLHNAAGPNQSFWLPQQFSCSSGLVLLPAITLENPPWCLLHGKVWKKQATKQNKIKLTGYQEQLSSAERGESRILFLRVVIPSLQGEDRSQVEQREDAGRRALLFAADC